jgi:hypothetical protein
MNRHDRRKADKLSRRPGNKPRTHRINTKPMFELPDDEMAIVMQYEHSHRHDIPTDVLHLMYKGAREINPHFAVQVLDWIALRQN